MHIALALLKSFIGGNGLLVALIAGGGLLFWSYDSARVSEGRRLERADADKANAKLAENASKARDAVDGADALKRLRNQYCRDC